MSNATDTHDSLDDFWTARIAEKAAAMDTETLRREHAAICDMFASAMSEGWAPAAWMWRRLGVLQAEHGRRAVVTPDPRPETHAGPLLVSYEVTCGDGPGALPVRLGLPVLCF